MFPHKGIIYKGLGRQYNNFFVSLLHAFISETDTISILIQ